MSAQRFAVTPGEDRLGLFRDSPLVEVNSCVQDWAMSKQKPYSKNKKLGFFTNSKFSKRKFSKKNDHN